VQTFAAPCEKSREKLVGSAWAATEFKSLRALKGGFGPFRCLATNNQRGGAAAVLSSAAREAAFCDSFGRPMTPPNLTPQARRELAARALTPEKTIRRVYAHPEQARSTTLERIARATRELGLPEPLPPNGSEAA
jgi:hypothetical protein